jgi:hypothetical protein
MSRSGYPNYNYSSQVLGRRFVAQFVKGKDQRRAGVKSNAARRPLEVMGLLVRLGQKGSFCLVSMNGPGIDGDCRPYPYIQN